MDKTQEIWSELQIAHVAAEGRNRTAYDQGYRNGLLDAYAILTGSPSEFVYEQLTAWYIGDHERRMYGATSHA